MLKLRVAVSPYTRVQDQISTPFDFYVVSYSYVNLPECLYTASRVDEKMNGCLFTKLPGCF